MLISVIGNGIGMSRYRCRDIQLRYIDFNACGSARLVVRVTGRLVPYYIGTRVGSCRYGRRVCSRFCRAEYKLAEICGTAGHKSFFRAVISAVVRRRSCCRRLCRRYREIFRCFSALVIIGLRDSRLYGVITLVCGNFVRKYRRALDCVCITDSAASGVGAVGKLRSVHNRIILAVLPAGYGNSRGNTRLLDNCRRAGFRGRGVVAVGIDIIPYKIRSGFCAFRNCGGITACGSCLRVFTESVHESTARYRTAGHKRLFQAVISTVVRGHAGNGRGGCGYRECTVYESYCIVALNF